MKSIWDQTPEEVNKEIAKGNQGEIHKQTLALLEMLKLIGEATQKNKLVQVENIIRQVVGEVSVTRPDWIKELLPNTLPLEKKLDYIASAIIRKEVVRKMDFNRPTWLDEIKPKEINFPEAKDFSKPQTDLLKEILTAIQEQEKVEEVSIKGEVKIAEPKWWKLPDFEKPVLSLASFIKKYFDKVVLKTEIQNEITIKNPIKEIKVLNPQKEVAITNLSKMEKSLDLMTAQLRSLGTTGSNSNGGSTVDTSSLATEETLQAVLAASGGSITALTKYDNDAQGFLLYKGENASATADGSESNWKIYKTVYDGSMNKIETIIKTGVWDDRTTLF